MLDSRARYSAHDRARRTRNTTHSKTHVERVLSVVARAPELCDVVFLVARHERLHFRLAQRVRLEKRGVHADARAWSDDEAGDIDLET